MQALAGITKAKEGLTDPPENRFVRRLPDSSAGRWTLLGGRYLVATVTREPVPASGTVYAAEDGRYFTLAFVHTRVEADALAARTEEGARIFAVRSDLGVPAPA